MDENVLHLAYYAIYIVKDFRHSTLENLWRWSYAKLKAIKTVAAKWFYKRSQQSWLFIKGKLSESTISIEFREEAAFSQLGKTRRLTVSDGFLAGLLRLTGLNRHTIHNLEQVCEFPCSKISYFPTFLG